MFFRQLASKESSLSYFFGCAGHKKAVAIDVVAGDEDWFMDEARKAAFLDAVTREIPPRPAGMEAMLRANLGLAA